MSTNVKMASAEKINALTKMYAKVNESKFDGMLPYPVITIESRANQKEYAHITCKKVWHDGEEEKYGLCFASEYLNRSPLEMVCTLVHEMIHIYCLEQEIKDTSNRGRFHNGEFKRVAEHFGLTVEKSEECKSAGWSFSIPEHQTDDFKKYAESIMKDSFNLYRDITPKATGTKKNKTNSHSIKYVCPCCSNTVRATKMLKVICGDCMVEMETNEN